MFACIESRPAYSHLGGEIPTRSGHPADSFRPLRAISVDGVYPDPVGTSEFTQGRPSASALLIVVPLHIHSLAGACELDLSRSYREDPGPAETGWASLPSLVARRILTILSLAGACDPARTFPSLVDHTLRILSLAGACKPA